MIQIDNEMEDKLNDIGIDLSELQRLSRIIQTCFEDDKNLEKWDVETVFEILKLKIIEIKKNFSNIQAELEI